MKGWLKLLVLGAVPILAVTMVADQALAADKGSQLIFRANSDHVNFISVTNSADDLAVTVLVQYYNESMEMVVWYLRVLPANANVLVDPFDHMIPGTATEDNEAGTNVMDAIMASGKASTHYVIAVTAVGANMNGLPQGTDATDVATGTAAANTAATANVLFPDYLAEDLHETDNIDNGGVITNSVPDIPEPVPDDESVVNQNLIFTDFTAPDDMPDADDNTSKNVGDLAIGNAEPISFNHLTGHFTEALVGGESGSDQTAAWGGTPVIRPAVNNNNNMAMLGNYITLNGTNPDGETPSRGGRLAEKDAGGNEKIIYNRVEGWLSGTDNMGDSAITDGHAFNRGLTGGGIVLPAAHGGGVEGATQIMLLLSVADDFGNRAIGMGGDYKLIAAKTGLMVSLMDNMGRSMMDPDAADAPVFGGVEAEEEDAKSAAIIVDGISVMVNADLGECSGDAITGPWTVGHLTELMDTGASEDFGGLKSMGLIKFTRMDLTCEVPYGDGDQANLMTIENPDGVPIENDRTYTAGTLITEEMNSERTFVTTGQALLKLELPDSTFAASWSLKSPPSTDDGTREAIDPDGDDTTSNDVTVPDDITTRPAL